MLKDVGHNLPGTFLRSSRCYWKALFALKFATLTLVSLFITYDSWRNRLIFYCQDSTLRASHPNLTACSIERKFKPLIVYSVCMVGLMPALLKTPFGLIDIPEVLILKNFSEMVNEKIGRSTWRELVEMIYESLFECWRPPNYRKLVGASAGTLKSAGSSFWARGAWGGPLISSTHLTCKFLLVAAVVRQKNNQLRPVIFDVVILDRSAINGHPIPQWILRWKPQNRFFAGQFAKF